MTDGPADDEHALPATHWYFTKRPYEGQIRHEDASGARCMLPVSHDAGAVRSLCEAAVWIDRGTMRAAGTAAEVVDAYLAASAG